MKIDAEFVLGAVRRTHIEDENIVDELVQDVEPILDMNRRFRNGDRPHTPMDGFAIKVAAIPLVIVETWLTKYGVDVNNPAHRPRMIALLNSSEWSYLKTVDEIL